MIANSKKTRQNKSDEQREKDRIIDRLWKAKSRANRTEEQKEKE